VDTNDRLTGKSAETPPAADVIWAPVIWFFDKNGEKIRYEISHERRGGRYRVVITHPDGSQSVAEVDEPTELITRSVQLMNALRSDGWQVGTNEIKN
jgi:hypothetical protein